MSFELARRPLLDFDDFVPIQNRVSFFANVRQRITNVFKRNENLVIHVGLNFLRDFAWAWWSYQNLSDRITQTADTGYDSSGESLGQCVAGSTAMVAGYFGIWAGYLLAKKIMPKKDSIIYVAAASAAIMPWDAGQQLGIALGQKKLELSPSHAGLFASVFTGGAEGLVQNLVIRLGSLLRYAEEREKYKLNPCRYISTIAAEFGLSFTVGAAPGAVWQLVYVAGVVNHFGPALTSSLVASAVAATNIGCNKLNDYILQACRLGYPTDVDIARARENMTAGIM